MLLRDPFEKEMLDTETFPVFDAKEQGQKYIVPAVAWRKGELPDASDVQRTEVIERLRLANSDIPKVDFQQATEWLWPRLANPALLRFMLDDYGADSRFFVPWLMDIPSARSMEPASGYGYDLTGRWQRIPQSDPFYLWVIRSPAFVGFRDRMYFAANMLRGAGDAAILACGDSPELTRTGFQFHPVDQQIYMCDIDPEINPEENFGQDLREIGVHYQRLDFRKFLAQYDKQFSYVVMNGLMSYLGPILPVLSVILPAVKPGGKIEFDLQLEHWELLRAVAVFGWPAGSEKAQIELAKGVDDAVRKVEAACRNLNVAVDFYPDTRNPEPTGVIFCITKLS